MDLERKVGGFSVLYVTFIILQMAATRLKSRLFGITTLLSGAYISINNTDINAYNHKLVRNVIVTSKNPDKLRAVHNAFNEHFKDSNLQFNIIGYKSDSGIYHGQPWGLQHTFEGAKTRIQSIKDKLNKSKDNPDPSYIVSAENGVESLLQHDKTIGIDIACVIVEILDGNQQYIGLSQGRPYPLETIQHMKRNGVSNKEIGDFCVKHYEQANLCITREDQIYQATLIALSQIQ